MPNSIIWNYTSTSHRDSWETDKENIVSSLRFRKHTWSLRAYCKKEEESCLSKYWWNILVNRWEKLLVSKTQQNCFLCPLLIISSNLFLPMYRNYFWTNGYLISYLHFDCYYLIKIADNYLNSFKSISLKWESKFLKEYVMLFWRNVVFLE